jgi:hypothetical protein
MSLTDGAMLNAIRIESCDNENQSNKFLSNSVLYTFRASFTYFIKAIIMSQDQGTNLDEDVLQHSSGVRNQPGGSIQGIFDR